MKRLLPLAFALLLFTGCVTSNNFVVLRDVPPNPSFSVISATDYWGQHDFANQVEEALVNLGVAVITPPASKEVLTRKGVSIDGMGKGLVGSRVSDSMIVEKYYTLDESTADYLIFTESGSKRIKIVKRTARQVIATFTIAIADKAVLVADIYGALKELNIPVKNKPENFERVPKIF